MPSVSRVYAECMASVCQKYARGMPEVLMQR